MRFRRLTILAVAAGATGCTPHVANDAELALAVAASDSVTQALSDSLAPLQGFAVRQAGAPAESFSACHDNEESVGWQTVGSLIVEMELPSSNYTADAQTKDHAGWTGSTGAVHVSEHRGANHGWWSNDITSECDIYISGSPAHIDLVTTRYGRAVYATIRPSDAPPIELEARAQSGAEQSQLLHSIRTARISAAWGKKD
ncbi:MAG TPA: hypothetical protein VGP84_07490 [Gemmatimonadaceae bacterium]|jgi:hypothetical protein|nr:hypothetical protein [Gemmatimonadaceae bacterium]